MATGYPVEIGAKNATAAATYARVSAKNGRVVCRKVNGMTVKKAKGFLQGLLDQNVSINGKHFTTTAEKVLEVIESAEKNAQFKGLGDKLVVRTITAERGPARLRRKRMGGRRLKIAHIKVVLESLEEKKKAPSEAKPTETPKPAETKTPKKSGEKQ